MRSLIDWLADARDYFADKLRLRGQGHGRHVLPAGERLPRTEPAADPEPSEPFEFRYVPDTARLEVHHDFPTPGQRAGYWREREALAPSVIAALEHATPEDTAVTGATLPQYVRDFLTCAREDIADAVRADKIGLAVRPS